MAVGSEAKKQTVFPIDTVDQFHQWTVVGGADEITTLTDADDATFIKSLSTADTNAYIINGISVYNYEQPDIIDSFKIGVYVKDFDIIGDAELRVGVRISTDISWGGTIPVDGQAFFSAYRSFSAPPGSRGTWDRWELDSTEVLFNPVTVTGDSIAIAACTVWVFTTFGNPHRLYFTIDTSNCTAGSNFSKEMERTKPIRLDTVKIHVPILTTETDYYFSGTGHPFNTDWETGGFKVHLNVIKNVQSAPNADSSRFRVSRVNSTCTVQESTPYTPWMSISGTGEKTFSIAAHEWTFGASDDRMRLEMQSKNVLSVGEDSIWFTTGVYESRVDMDVADNSPEEQSGCLDLVDTLRVSDTAAMTAMQEWDNYNAYAFQKDTFQINAFQESYGSTRVAKITSLQDRISGTAIFEATAQDTQIFVLDNTAIPASGYTITSVEATAFARRKTTGVTTTVKWGLMMDGGTNYCYGSDKTLNGSYTAYTDIFTATPTGAGTCAGSFSNPRLDSLNIVFVSTAVGANDTILVGQFDVYVCYTTAAAATPKIIMIEIGLWDDPAVLVKESPYLAVAIRGEQEERWLWSE